MKALLIHLPGVPWECIARDDAATLLPTLHFLIESGSAGPLEAVGPHPAMDGAILTGRDGADSGLSSARSPRPDGFGHDLTGAMHLNVPTFARHLDQAGKRCALVNLRGTHFDELANGIVASDAMFEIRARSYADWGIPPGALSPIGMASQLAELRVHPDDLEPSQLGPLLASEGGEVKPDQLRTLARALAESSGAHATATWLAEHGALEVCAVRYPLLTQLGGLFADPAQCGTGKGTAWTLIALLDAFIARMLALAGEDAMVHITGGTDARPFWIARGPGAAVDMLWPEDTSLYDVAPSMLALFSLVDLSMPGQPRVGGARDHLMQVAPVTLPAQVLALPDGFGGPAA